MALIFFVQRPIVFSKKVSGVNSPVQVSCAFSIGIQHSIDSLSGMSVNLVHFDEFFDSLNQQMISKVIGSDSDIFTSAKLLANEFAKKHQAVWHTLRLHLDGYDIILHADSDCYLYEMPKNIFWQSDNKIENRKIKVTADSSVSNIDFGTQVFSEISEVKKILADKYSMNVIALQLYSLDGKSSIESF